MERVVAYLSDSGTLLRTLIVMAAVAMAFPMVNGAIGGPLLDLIADRAGVAARLAEMTEAQRYAHLWFTLTLDMSYPIAYGTFFAGFAARFAGRFALFAIVPGLALLVTDLFENMLIISALLGNDGVAGLTAAVTQAKWLLFAIAFLLAMIMGLAALLRHWFTVSTGAAAPAPEER